MEKEKSELYERLYAKKEEKMNIQQLKRKREELDKQIAEIENKNNWLAVPELNIEVEIKIHNKNKSWNDCLKEGIFKEEDLLTVEQFIFLANHKEYSKILKMDGSSSSDDFYIQQPFNQNRNKVAVFVAYSGGAGLYCNRNPADRDESFGVRRCRKLKVNK
ncbi:MAG: hypothetical protein U0945_14175 [Flavobacterium sp.]|nr:hypothetical protein [Flavobacterium sp.]